LLIKFEINMIKNFYKNFRKRTLFVKSKNLFYKFLRPRFLYFLFQKKKPLSNIYGAERGIPLDRYYIENFLENNKQFIKGHCLELLNNDYTTKYGGKKVVKSDILDIDKNNMKANIFADIKDLHIIKDQSYDCVILTQVLQFIDDYDLAVKECYRILKHGGVLLVTLPSISRIDCASGLEGDYWRFTVASAKYIFGKFFELKKIEINSYGNALTGLYFWIGASQQELSKKKLNYIDKNFPTLITLKAVK